MAPKIRIQGSHRGLSDSSRDIVNSNVRKCAGSSFVTFLVGGDFIMAIQSPVANAAITVLCSNSSRAVMDELVPQFERATGHKVAIKYDAAQLMLKRIAQGETAD